MKITKQQLDSIIKEELEAVVAERCWDGYERVPNKREGEQGSCRKQGSVSEEVIDEKKKKKKKKKKAKKKDACYHKVRSRYDVWPSAYASGALVKCRKVGAKNWGKSTTKEELELYEGKESLESKIRNALIEEGGAAGMKALKDHTEASEKEIKDAIKGMEDVGLHEDGDYILQDKKEIHVEKGLEEKKKKKKKKKAGTESGKESNLSDWFGRKGAKGKKGGWVDCNTCRKDKKTGRKKCKACGRESGEKRAKYPSCRPTPGACGEKGKGKSWGKKSAKKESLEMKKQTIMEMIKEAMDDVRDTYGSEVSDRNKQSIKDGSKALKLTEEENEYYSMLSEGEVLEEAEYQGRKVTLNKPMRGDVKKSKVYVKNAKGNVVKVNFGDKNMKIKKSNPKRRKSFRARHKCKTPGPKWKARYWSCKAW